MTLKKSTRSIPYTPRRFLMKRLLTKIVPLTFVLILASSLTFADEKKETANPSPPLASTTELDCKPAFLDINTATVVQLEALPGIDDAYAKMIIAGRPYANRDELKDRKIIPDAAYDMIKDYIVAK